MTTRPGPSTERILEAVQHTLIAAVSVVVAVVVIVAFLRVVAGDDPAADAADAPIVGPTMPEGVVTPGSTVPPEIVVVDPETPGNPGTTAPSRCGRQRPDAEPGQMVIRVFMPCGDLDLPSNSTYVFRSVDESTALLTHTLEQLVAGPTPEERADGFTSSWSSETADAINSVQLADGAVQVNFGSPVATIRGINDEPARSFFLADIYTSLFQYERVRSVELRLGNDCAAFFALLGQQGCTVVDRGGWEAQLAQWQAEG
jgi:hypothetical protein